MYVSIPDSRTPLHHVQLTSHCITMTILLSTCPHGSRICGNQRTFSHTRFLISAGISAFLFASAQPVSAFSQSSPTDTPHCVNMQLTVSSDDGTRMPSGTSASGTLLVLRNLSTVTCMAPARPVIGFEDSARHPLPVAPAISRGMHPGPVLLPIPVPPQARLVSRIRWTPNDASGASHCVSAAFITVAVGEQLIRQKFKAQLCSPANKTASYSVGLFQRDPSDAPSAR
jgi:hypothetical protein